MVSVPVRVMKMVVAVSDEVDTWDMYAQNWVVGPNMGTARYNHEATVLSGVLYAVGGLDSQGHTLNSVESSVITSTGHNPFSPAGTSPSMITARDSFALIAFEAMQNNELPFLLAVGGSGKGGNPLSAAEKWTPGVAEYWTAPLAAASPQAGWKSISPLHTPRTNCDGVVFGGKVYILGGLGGTPLKALSSVECYDPERDTWRDVPAMTMANNYPNAVTLSPMGERDRIYVVSGTSQNNVVGRPAEAFGAWRDCSSGQLSDICSACSTIPYGGECEVCYWSKCPPSSSPLPPRCFFLTSCCPGPLPCPGKLNWATISGQNMTPRMMAAATTATLDADGDDSGAIVIMGGTGLGGASLTGPSVEILRANNNTWEKLPNMPKERSQFAAASLGSTVFALGGSTKNYLHGTNSVVTYDLANGRNGSWKTGTNMTTARRAAAAAVLDEFIYVAGGMMWTGRTYYPLQTVERFKGGQSTWESIVDMNKGRSNFALIALEEWNIIVAAGGYIMADGISGPSNSAEVFTPGGNDISDEWTDIADLNQSRRACAGAALYGKAYVSGGVDKDNNTLDSVEVYDPADPGKWLLAPKMSEPRAYHTAVCRRVEDSSGMTSCSLVVMCGEKTDSEGGTDKLSSSVEALACPPTLSPSSQIAHCITYHKDKCIECSHEAKEADGKPLGGTCLNTKGNGGRGECITYPVQGGAGCTQCNPASNGTCVSCQVQDCNVKKGNACDNCITSITIPYDGSGARCSHLHGYGGDIPRVKSTHKAAAGLKYADICFTQSNSATSYPYGQSPSGCATKEYPMLTACGDPQSSASDCSSSTQKQCDPPSWLNPD